MITFRNFNTIPGNHAILNPVLRMVTPLKVRVETIEYDIIQHPQVPVNREVAYRSLFGALIFPDDLIFDGSQRVYCQFKIGV